jgi:hypothetical protein
MVRWIDEIAAKSKGSSILTAIGAGQYELQLDCVSSKLTSTSHEDGPGRWVAARDIEVVMAVLLARLTAPAETANAISLAHGNQPIAWEDFFFNDDEHEAAYNRMVTVREAIPVAVRGRVEWVGITNLRAARVRVLAFPMTRATSLHAGFGSIEGTRLSVFSRSLDQFDEVKRGDEVIAFGLWETRVADAPISLDRPSQTAALALARMEPLCMNQVEVVTSSLPANVI